MKQLVIAVLLVSVFTVIGSQSVYAQTTPTPSSCHWWQVWCHNQSGGSNSGFCSQNQYGSSYCYGSGSGQYGHYQNGGYCNSNQYGVCYGSGSNYYPSNNCVNYACSYPSTPGYGQSPCPGYPYCSSSPSYYPAQQQVTYMSVSGTVTSASTLATGEGCVINLLGGNVYQYLGQTVLVTGEGTTMSSGTCPYVQLTVSTVTPISSGVPQSQPTTTTATTTITQSPTTTTTPLAIQPTTDYTTPILVGGIIFLVAIAIVGMFVYLIKTHPSQAQPQYQQPNREPQPQGQTTQ